MLWGILQYKRAQGQNAVIPNICLNQVHHTVLYHPLNRDSVVMSSEGILSKHSSTLLHELSVDDGYT